MSNQTNTIDDLRNLLMETMRGVKDGSLDIERAKAVSDIGQTVINAAKVEVEYAKATGQAGCRFLGNDAAPALPSGDTVTPVPGGRIVTHKLKG